MAQLEEQAALIIELTRRIESLEAANEAKKIIAENDAENNPTFEDLKEIVKDSLERIGELSQRLNRLEEAEFQKQSKVEVLSPPQDEKPAPTLVPEPPAPVPNEAPAAETGTSAPSNDTPNENAG